LTQKKFAKGKNIQPLEISLGVKTNIKRSIVMRFLTLVLAFVPALFAQNLHAQEILFSDNFDNCALAQGWQVTSVGNQNPVWYIGSALQNDDNNGQSMNGSCFLVLDDDATGDQTPAYTIDFKTPAFDASQYATVLLTVDVHYRDWTDGNEWFEVLVTDGTTEKLVSRFDETRSTGDNLEQFVTVRYDLSLLTQSPNARIIFRYDDANAFNWWVALDNVQVQGFGTGKNVVAEPFNQCALPDGWTSEILAGNVPWQFGKITNPAMGTNPVSMDGTCFVYFDDDILGNTEPFSVARFHTPWFDGDQYSEFELNFDLILRYYSEVVRVLVEHPDGSNHLVYESSGDVGGPFFDNYVPTRLDLTPHRAAQMRVVFEFDDGKDWGWWAGIDNVKVTGRGTANDVCKNAVQIYSGLSCLPGTNVNALFDGPAATCVERSSGGAWYRWKADFGGNAQFTTAAQFNDVVSVFTGTCDNLTLVQCNNRDEHGFTGETTVFATQNNTEYLLRVSGRASGFGAPTGSMCVAVAAAGTLPVPPTNDQCGTATLVNVNNGTPQAGNNQHADMTAAQPSHNLLARSDIWYRFVAPALAAGEQLEIKSNANFSDIITLYSGTCNGLTEVATSYLGQRLVPPALTTGQTYFVQVAGTFATVEGKVGIEINKRSPSVPANDDCTGAPILTLGAACTSGTLLDAARSAFTPACVPSVGRDVWFRFVAPASGAVRVRTLTDMEHVIGIWKGTCNNLEYVNCLITPDACEGGKTYGALIPDQTYFLQLAARSVDLVPTSANFCIAVADGAIPFEVAPLMLTIEEKCTSDNTARLKITYEGGTAPLTLLGNQQNDLLAAGESYLVVLRDDRGCEKSISGIVKPCEALNCAVSGLLSETAITCAGGNNGALSATVTGGAAPYIYAWSNGTTNATASGLAQGVYSVTVSDALGCELVLNANLAAPSPILVVLSNVVSPQIGQNDGAVYVEVAGGTGVFTYNWAKNGTTIAQSEDLTNVGAGAYSLVVTDANGCSVLFQFVLTEVVSGTEPKQEHYMEVFPNPAREKAWLSLSFATARTAYVSIVDANGRIVRAWTYHNVSEQNFALDLRRLPAGAYQVVVRTEKEVLQQPLIVRD
jgi:hypothetical protein